MKWLQVLITKDIDSHWLGPWKQAIYHTSQTSIPCLRKLWDAYVLPLSQPGSSIPFHNELPSHFLSNHLWILGIFPKANSQPRNNCGVSSQRWMHWTNCLGSFISFFTHNALVCKKTAAISQALGRLCLRQSRIDLHQLHLHWLKVSISHWWCAVTVTPKRFQTQRGLAQ